MKKTILILLILNILARYCEGQLVSKSSQKSVAKFTPLKEKQKIDYIEEYASHFISRDTNWFLINNIIESQYSELIYSNYYSFAEEDEKRPHLPNLIYNSNSDSNMGKIDSLSLIQYKECIINNLKLIWNDIPDLDSFKLKEVILQKGFVDDKTQYFPGWFVIQFNKLNFNIHANTPVFSFPERKAFYFHPQSFFTFYFTDDMHLYRKEHLSKMSQRISENRNLKNELDKDAVLLLGNGDIGNFIQSNIKVPINAKKENYHGKVKIKIVISAKGDLAKVEVVEGLNKEANQEAIRVVKLMKKWKPAENAGKKISSSLIIPIHFAND